MRHPHSLHRRRFISAGFSVLVTFTAVVTFTAGPARYLESSPSGDAGSDDSKSRSRGSSKANAASRKSDQRGSTVGREIDVGFDTVHAKGRGAARIVDGKVQIEESSELYKGRILEITKTSILMDSWRGKHEIPRSSVTKIDRIVDESAAAVFEKFRQKAKSRTSWVKLLDFAKKNELVPEQRVCLRALARIEPRSEEHRIALGQRMLDGKWIDELEVQKLLQMGYEVTGKKLRKSESGDAKTGGGASSKRPRKNPKDIKAVDHLERAIVKADAHSLWMLLARSAVLSIPGSKERLNMAACRKFIDRLESLGDYEFRIRAYLAEEGVPRDWAQINIEKAKAFVEKHGEEDSIHLETHHYHILSTMDEQATKEFGAKMDLVTRQVYQTVFEFEEQIPFKYIVRIYRNEREYNRNGGPRGAGAHYEPHSKELVGYPSGARDSYGMDTYKSMFHEGWHQYFDFYIPNAPRWFDEGFAEIVSPVTFKAGKAKMNPFNPMRSQHVKVFAQRGRLVPLDQLIRMSHREFYRRDVVGIAYAQAWSFIYFLTNFKHRNPATQRKVRGFYKAYFWELHRGTDPVKACDIVFKDVKFHTLEKAWRDAIPNQRG